LGVVLIMLLLSECKPTQALLIKSGTSPILHSVQGWLLAYMWAETMLPACIC